METLRFEPTIGADLPIDRQRRKAGENAAQDMFTDLLGDRMKKHAEAERLERIAARRDRAEQRPDADQVFGRPIRVALAHTPTVRGEAREVDQPAELGLPDQARQGSEGACVPSERREPATTTPVGAEPGMTDSSSDTPDDKEQPSDPIATTLVSVAAIEQDGGVSDLGADGVELVDPSAGLPAPQGDEAETSADMAEGEAAPEQQIAEAALDASLSAAVALLETSGSAATGAVANAPGAMPPQLPPVPAAAVSTPAAIAGMAEFEAQIAELTEPSAPEPQAARPAADLKPRPGQAARPNAADVHGSGNQPATPQGQLQPQFVAGLQADARAEFASPGGFEELPAAGDDSGPGWALHLAQGAAGKRAEFVAQLRQHLQNLPAHEQVAVHIQRAVREGTGKFSIQLSPAELGRIQVKLEIDEEKRVTAAVTVERPSTLELLQRDIKGLERALHDAGLKMDGSDLSFSLGQSNDQEWAREQNRFGAAGGGGQAGLPSDGDQPMAGSGDVLDTAAGVVNVQV